MFPVLTLAAALAANNEPFPYEEAESELSEAITAAELKAHVYRLASPEYAGRRGPGAARTAQHLADLFRKLKLKPAFDDSYFQPIPWLVGDEKAAPSFVGRNVVGILPGSDPKLKDEWVVLSAHFDHLGKKGDAIYYGADDNASGVAGLIEVAERFALGQEKPRRTIVFAAFDQEETGLLGSTHFCSHPPLEFPKLRAFLTADMIGRSMANVMDDYVFALGCESSPDLRKLVEETTPEDGLKVGRIGTDLIGTRSDYGPFRDRKVPYLFFSTGPEPDYHRTTDTPDKLDYEKMRKIANWIYDVTRKLADTEASPKWATETKPDPDEARTIATVLTRVLSKPDKFPLTDTQKTLAKGFRDKMTALLTKGTVTASERSGYLWSARLLLATVFE